MSLHACLINENTVEFLKQVNGGVKPEIEDKPTVLVYADDINDPENEILGLDEFNEQYDFVYTHNAENNTVVKK